MKDIALSREEVLSWPHETDLLNARPWRTDWTGIDLPTLRGLVDRWMPPAVRFLTSGSTGEPKPWEVRPEQMLTEVLALSDELAGPGLDGVVAFAPPRHRYGAHCSVLLPAVLSCPVWVRPRSLGALPDIVGGRWLVVAIPSTFEILRQRLDWLASARSVTILHSSTRLPTSALDLVGDVGGDVSLVELLGSTETGAVATRQHPPGGDVWKLVPGVDFAAEPPRPKSQERLAVHSPWVACPPVLTGAYDPHLLDDIVERVDNRRFQLLARSGRIVKVNGERHHLDDVAARFEQQLGGRDVACLGVADPVVGEHFELYVVDTAGHRSELDGQIRRAIRTVGLCPRRVRLVAEITTSATGKIVFGQASIREDPKP